MAPEDLGNRSMEFRIKIDDRQVKAFAKKSPDRAHWALMEAHRAGGATLRKRMRAYIHRGGAGWPPLAWDKNRKPLEALRSMVRYRVTASRKTNKIRARIGFFFSKGRGMSTIRYRKQRERFRASFGMTPQALAKIHEYGKTIRVTPAMRRKAAALGHPLRKGTRHIRIPRRAVIEPVWRKNARFIGGYVEKKFFDNFFSVKRPKLAF